MSWDLDQLSILGDSGSKKRGDDRKEKVKGSWPWTHTIQSPGKIKRREVSWTLKRKLAQKRSRGGRWCWAR